MKSAVIKRSIIIAGHKTSVSLEAEFWELLKEVALHRHTTLSNLATSINDVRGNGNLSSAIRLFLLGVIQNEINIIKANAIDQAASQVQSRLERRASVP